MRTSQAEIIWVTEEADIDNIADVDVIVVAENEVSPAGDAAAAARAKAIKAKLLKLKPQANSLALDELGVKDKDVLQDVKALFVFGEAEQLPDNLAYLAVMSSQITEATQKADVALPLATYLETHGTYYNNEGTKQVSQQVLKPQAGMTNQEILQQLL